MLKEWFTRLRIRQLRKAKMGRLERFHLAMHADDMRAATKHRRALFDYTSRIAALTGEPEPLSFNP